MTNEYDYQFENSVLNRLEESLHFTYSVWPSSEIKKNVPLNMYQRPIYNFKLECANDKARSMTSVIERLTSYYSDSTWYKMLTDFGRMGVAILIVVLIVPIGSAQATVICTPIAFTCIAGMFVSILSKTMVVYYDLKSGKITAEIPNWV